MFKNYLKTAIRNIVKEKGYSFINILGLSIGMAACILIMFWVFDELSFDKFHENSQSIYQINKSYIIGGKESYNPSLPMPLVFALRNDFAEVKYATAFSRYRALFRYGDKIFNETNICETDSSFFDVFSFEFLYGNRIEALKKPNTLVITERIAKKYFGDENPIGKSFILNDNEDYQITGVLKNIPSNSTYKFDIYIPMTSQTVKDYANDWTFQFLNIFVKLVEKSDIAVFNKKIEKLAEVHLTGEKTTFHSNPLHKIHLYSIDGKSDKIQYIYFFSIIAVFILFIACINFMNLTTARSTKRAKEVGVRKVIGAGKKHIILQFLGESIIQVLIAMIFAFLLVELVKHPFNNLTAKAISIQYTNVKIIGFFVFISFIIGIIAGFYPALLFSTFKPVKILKGFSTGRTGSKFRLRKILVVIQFIITITLLISTYVIFQQNEYARTRDLGFNKDNILFLRMNKDVFENFDAIKTELLQNPDIKSISRTSSLPSSVWTIARGITWEGKETDEGAAFALMGVDYDFLKTLNLKIVMGRGFSKEFISDSANVIINEKAAAMIGDDVLHRYLNFDEENPNPIIGVVKDFNSLPLTYEIEPMVMAIIPSYYRFLLIDIHGENIQQSVGKIEKVWQKFCPSFPFDYHFLDEEFDINYQNEIRMGKIFGYFVVLAIFISCLGLFGLSAFTTEHRRKEIGIRKVQGASIFNLVYLLSKEFAIWVLVANIFAWPIAYIILKNWLNHFAFRINLSIWPFFISAFGALVIALLTVSWQTVKAARANPIESLKYE